VENNKSVILFTLNFQKAIETDSLILRPKYLNRVYYTPKQFGGGPDKAKPILENSLRKHELFNPQKRFNANRGKQMVEEMLRQISEAKQ
jgi:hypothetical protein